MTASREIALTPTKTYATLENARKAVASRGFEHLRHFITIDHEGRFFPVFLGQEAAQEGVHFHFCTI